MFLYINWKNNNKASKSKTTCLTDYEYYVNIDAAIDQK